MAEAKHAEEVSIQLELGGEKKIKWKAADNEKGSVRQKTHASSSRRKELAQPSESELYIRPVSDTETVSVLRGGWKTFFGIFILLALGTALAVTAQGLTDLNVILGGTLDEKQIDILNRVVDSAIPPLVFMFGTLIVILAIVLKRIFDWWPRYCQSFRRGYTTTDRWIWNASMIIVVAMIFSVLFALVLSGLEALDGFGEVMDTILTVLHINARSVLKAAERLVEVQALVATWPAEYQEPVPGPACPPMTDEHSVYIKALLVGNRQVLYDFDWTSLNPSGVKALSALILDYSSKGADMVQSLLGTYRLYNFLSYQTIVAAMAFVVAGIARRRPQMFDRAVMSALVGIMFVLGTLCVIRPLLVIMRESLDLKQAADGSQSETTLTGLLAYCSGSDSTLNFNGAATLASKLQGSDATTITGAQLNGIITTLSREATALQDIFAKNPDYLACLGLDNSLQDAYFKLLDVLTVIGEIISCSAAFTAFTRTEVLLNNEVLRHFNETVAFQVALCMLLVSLILVAYVCKRVVNNPLRTWYDDGSDRWFRMRAAFITARRLRRRKERVAEEAGLSLSYDPKKTPWRNPWATSMELGNTMYNAYFVSLCVLPPEALLIGLLNQSDEPEAMIAMSIGCVLCFLSGMYAAPQICRPGAHALALPAHFFSQLCALGVSALSAMTIGVAAAALRDCESDLDPDDDEQGGTCTFDHTFRHFSSITFATTQLVLSLLTFLMGAAFYLARIKGFSDADFKALEALRRNVDAAAKIDVGAREKKAKRLALRRRAQERNPDVYRSELGRGVTGLASTLTRVSEAAKDTKAQQWLGTIIAVKSFKVAAPSIVLVVIAPIVVISVLLTLNARSPIEDGPRIEMDAFMVPSWNKPGCNGAVEHCGRRIDQLVWATSHNSMSNAEEGWIAPNHDKSLETQLDLGIRGLGLDVHTQKSSAGKPTAYLCHSNCLMGRILMSEYMSRVKAWLARNPNEVVVIVLEMYADQEEVLNALNASATYDMLWELQYTGLTGESIKWPTLREMIDADKRILMMSDATWTERRAFPKIAYQFSVMLESPYALSEKAQMLNASSGGTGPMCGEDFDVGSRGLVSLDSRSADHSNGVYTLNHFLTRPLGARHLAQAVNYNPLLVERLESCMRRMRKLPNFLSVDFVNVGDVMEVVNDFNERVPGLIAEGELSYLA